jgi:hypothetical protein
MRLLQLCRRDVFLGAGESQSRKCRDAVVFTTGLARKLASREELSIAAKMVTITASTGGQPKVIQLNPNLLTPRTVGVQEDQPPFYINGGASGDINETSVEWRTTPYATTDKIWVTKNMDTDDSGQLYRDGGFSTDNVPIDKTKLYRYSVWVRKLDSTPGTTSGTTYLGPKAAAA